MLSANGSTGRPWSHGFNLLSWSCIEGTLSLSVFGYSVVMLEIIISGSVAFLVW